MQVSDIQKEAPNKTKRLGRGLDSLFGDHGSSSLMETPSEKPKAQAQTPGQNRQESSAKIAPPSGAATATTTTAPGPNQGLGATAAPSMTIIATPAAAPQIPAESRVWKVGIDKLKPSPFQPRSHFEKEKLEELAQSIRNSGIIQPIVARKSGPNGYEIIAGERRWRAAQLAGLHEVPVVLKELGDRETLELAIIENIQREDLNPMEEAEAYQRLGHEFSLTQQQVAEKVGRERASVANAIRLLQLPYAIREMIAKKELSVGHAKVLLSVPDATTQNKLAQQVLKEGLTVRKLEKLLKNDETAETKSANPTVQESVTKRLVGGMAEELQKLLGTKVTIDYNEGKGRLAIHFYEDEQLTSVVDRIRAGCQK